jgi:hypothetical protein
MNDHERLLRIVENTLQSLIARGITSIPTGVLNDILDLFHHTELDTLPEYEEN